MSDASEFIQELNNIIDTPDTSVVSTSIESKKIKILIVSTHINQSNGYSKVIHNIIKQLSSITWLTVIHFGTQQISNGEVGRTYPSNVKVIDGTSLEKSKHHGFAFQELPTVIQINKPDIVFIYNDLAVICNYIEEIRKTLKNRFFKIWAYVDITYKNPPQQMIDIMNRDVERVFCFTKTWKDEIKNQGITRPVDVMNHGIDKGIRCIPKELARQSLGLPKDVILYTSINKNIPRKRLDILIMAFVKLIIKFPVKPLFMLIVADTGNHGGYNLFDIFSREIKIMGGAIDMFGNRLLITSKDTCYRDDDINMLYNSGDVGVSCAEGEGFGLCTFEQMSLGIPQIVPDINGYSEYCNKDNSLMITPSSRYYIPQAHNTVIGQAELVNPEDVAKAMEKYAFDENIRKLHGKLAKEKVSEYTWSKCCEILIKRLSMIEDE